MAIPLNKLLPVYVRFGIKVGLSCVLAYTVSHLLGSHYALWAVVSSVIAMQVNVAESLQIGLLRISGTVIGALLGIAVLLATPRDPVAVGIAIFLITAVCGFLTPRSTRYSMISIAAIIVLLTGTAMPSEDYRGAISFGLLRILEIIIGVGASFVISMLIWPVRLLDTLRTDINLEFGECALLLDSLTTAFLEQQRHIDPGILDAMDTKVWRNHERLAKTRKHESYLYHYEHHIMDVQITTLDRTVESLRTMLESLNDYDEEGRDPLMGAEIRALADACMAALRHLGSTNPAAAVPDLVRRLTGGVDQAEQRLAELRGQGATRCFDLHKILQLFTFYQAMRMFTEYLLLALDRVQVPAKGYDV